MNKTINEFTKRIFSYEYDSKEFEKNSAAFQNEVNATIHKYGWDEVFSSWCRYLNEDCKTSKDLIRFANLFYVYTLFSRPVGDPFEFLSLFYCRIGNPLSLEDGDIIDDMAVSLIENAGYDKASNWVDPYYDPTKDQDLIDAVDKLKKKKIWMNLKFAD